MGRRRAGRLRSFGQVLADYAATAGPRPTLPAHENGRDPQNPPALTWGEPQFIPRSDGQPIGFTFERFHKLTAHLTPSQRLGAFLALPDHCQAEMYRLAEPRLRDLLGPPNDGR